MSKHHNGFTLVELAIVMIIIGLLISGVLKGQELVNNARIKAVIAQIKSIDAATTIFRDQFAAFPGDMWNAANRLPHCGALACEANISTSSTGSNGDGFINRGIFWHSNMTDESAKFFLHLLGADLITGISGDPTDSNIGSYLPPAFGSGGLKVGYVHPQCNAGTREGVARPYNLPCSSVRVGHYLMISQTHAVSAPVPGGDPGVMNPQQAAHVDRKLDNGSAHSGSVVIQDGPCKNGTDYVEGDLSLTCVVAVRIQH